MAILRNPAAMPRLERLSQEDRAELCARFNLKEAIESGGIHVTRAGTHFVCAIRDERTPSCHVYPPDVGQLKGRGWTYHDFGDGAGGDALGYFVDVKGMPFHEAVRYMAEQTGFWPASWNGTRGNEPLHHPVNVTFKPTPKTPSMAVLDQVSGVAAFLDVITRVERNALNAAQDYLRSRGCNEPLIRGAAVMLPADVSEIEATIVKEGLAKPFIEMGLGYATGGFRIAQHRGSPVCLLICHSPKGLPALTVGRQLDPKEGGKYLNQANAPDGAPSLTRVPFNLPALYQAASYLNLANAPLPCLWSGRNWKPLPHFIRKVVICEGPITALGAANLGIPAIAMLARPSAGHSHKVLLQDHLPALRALTEVLVVPDNDVDADKNQTGRAAADELSSWLLSRRVNASTVLLPELGAPNDCKDFADWAVNSNL